MTCETFSVAVQTLGIINQNGTLIDYPPAIPLLYSFYHTSSHVTTIRSPYACVLI